MKPSLNELRSAHPTDKFAIGYMEAFYNRLLVPRQESVRNVLEIGIQHGKSILLWRNFFVNATVFGVDVRPCDRIYGEERVIQVIGNAYDEALIQRWPRNFFDLVIDDGPHAEAMQRAFIEKYLPLVKPGGIWVLEDVMSYALADEFARMVPRAALHRMKGMPRHPEMSALVLEK